MSESVEPRSLVPWSRRSAGQAAAVLASMLGLGSESREADELSDLLREHPEINTVKDLTRHFAAEDLSSTHRTPALDRVAWLLAGVTDRAESGQGPSTAALLWTVEQRAALDSLSFGDLIAAVEAAGEERVCRRCGCTDNAACLTAVGPCAWTVKYADNTGICSACPVPVSESAGGSPPSALPAGSIAASARLWRSQYEARIALNLLLEAHGRGDTDEFRAQALHLAEHLGDGLNGAAAAGGVAPWMVERLHTSLTSMVEADERGDWVEFRKNALRVAESLLPVEDALHGSADGGPAKSSVLAVAPFGPQPSDGHRPERIDELLAELGEYWRWVPDLQLAQIVHLFAEALHAARGGDAGPAATLSLDDDALLAMLRSGHRNPDVAAHEFLEQAQGSGNRQDQ